MGSVFLTDVDDYLGPSQACVNPLFTSSDATPSTTTKNDTAAAAAAATGAVKGEEDAVLSTASNPDTTIPRTNRRNVPRRPRRIRQPLKMQVEEEDMNSSSSNNPNNAVTMDDVTAEAAETATAEKATVSVADCLSCSGCVTSAEAVLVEQHSLPTLLQSIAEDAAADNDADASRSQTKKKKLVCTLSPASVADLYRHLQIGKERAVTDFTSSMDNHNSMATFYRQVASALGQSLHATLVLDASVPLQLSWIESAHEFCHRYETHHANKTQQQQQHSMNESMSTPSIALSATRTRYLHKPNNATEGRLLDAVEETHVAGREQTNHHDASVLVSCGSLPLLASSCPGFVCFVEKTAPSIVPHLSTAKSPMAMAGALVKHIFSTSLAAACYHVAVMPCHDKKLEAGRRDLAWDRINAGSTKIVAANPSSVTVSQQEPAAAPEEPPEPDVDLVLATSELYTLLLQEATTHHDNTRPNQEEEGSDGHDVVMADTRMEDGVVPSSTTLGTVSSEEERDWIIAYLESMPLAPCTGNLVDAAHVLTSRTGTNNTSSNSETITATTTTTTTTPPPLVLLNSHLMQTVHSTTKTDAIRMDTNESSGMLSSSSSSSAVEKKKDKDDETSDVMNVNGSGSYADFLFRYAARTLFQHSLDHFSVLPWKRVVAQRRPLSSSSSNPKTNNNMAPTHRRRVRTATATTTKTATRRQADHAELTLYHDLDHGTYSLDDDTITSNNVRPVLKFATAYGFKNVQLILQKLTKEKAQSVVSSSLEAKDDYHYIEVMACPSGCLNGGGQLITPTKEGRRETPAQVRARVTQTQTILTNFIGHNSRSLLAASDADQNDEKEESHHLYGTGALVSIPTPFDAKAQELLHTRFHVVPKLELTTGATAGVALSDTKW
eukprot:scaffold12539_cov42-Attheya_sp.AAC.2